jgi:hypothetical protein
MLNWMHYNQTGRFCSFTFAPCWSAFTQASAVLINGPCGFTLSRWIRAYCKQAMTASLTILVSKKWNKSDWDVYFMSCKLNVYSKTSEVVDQRLKLLT